ncbi:Stk1 family PASTA domain-containing Ser/Thr kinase [Bowdeniella nasicola]|uniref:Stk1 family PASTA domain-containing Ser/Thr kinase n=1 Tax=Bowdeniella nasicola TaxID=208480 RepID=UPI001C9E420B|nr:Stk1 family PASTA domain-containing Ser/Thr kinase [Bowdeniella nasicola]
MSETEPVIIDHRYRIVRRIARGGMSQVYVAHDQRLERDIALKIMHPYLAESEEFVRLFRREARAAARLSHPGVVAVHDQGQTGDSFYLTMEYVPGGNLRQRLDREGSLTLETALDITEQILAALDAAHRGGLVHRDVKPENVLLPTSGGVKVADFGLARAVSEASMSGTSTVLGTVAYLAPEVVTDGVSSPAADVYAVGILLYEMLTGAPPFTGERPIQVAFKHVNDSVPALSETIDWIPSEVDEFVAALVARSTSDREPDAATALAHLRRVIEDLPPDLLAKRHEVAPRIPAEAEQVDPGPDATQEISTRNTALIDRGAKPSKVAVPIGAVKKKPKADRPHRRRRWPLALALIVLLATGAGATWWFTIGPGGTRELPAVAGTAEASAVDQIRNNELEVHISREYHDTIESGVVIETDPGPGKVRVGTTVNIIVSKGIRTVTVPEVVGVSEADADSALQKAGVTKGETAKEHSDTVPAGTVISASHNPGTVIPHNESVTLTVSDGPAPITFPDVVGQARAEAEAALGELGLKISIAEEFSDSVDKGRVISMSPAAGAAGHRLDSVSLVVSKGPELFEVPSVFAKQVEEAEQVLRNAGFKVKVERVLGGVFGTVHSQDPKAGTMVPKGTTITIKVV